MHENRTSQSSTNCENNLSNNSSNLAYPGYYTNDGYSNYQSYLSAPEWSNNYGSQQQYETSEERGCWRKLYDYQSGHWYYQNLWTNTTQWGEPDGWQTWPVNGQDESKDVQREDVKSLRRSSEEIEKKNTEYIKRAARRQVDPEDAKKIHWRPEGANEYNIWYDRWIGDHWKGTKHDGTNTAAS